MFNLLKHTYQIIEYKNSCGQTKFVAKYENALKRALSFLGFEVYISSGGNLYYDAYYASHCSIEGAKQAIENHKSIEREKHNAQYKKLAIHYVE